MGPSGSWEEAEEWLREVIKEEPGDDSKLPEAFREDDYPNIPEAFRKKARAAAAAAAAGESPPASNDATWGGARSSSDTSAANRVFPKAKGIALISDASTARAFPKSKGAAFHPDAVSPPRNYPKAKAAAGSFGDSGGWWDHGGASWDDVQTMWDNVQSMWNDVHSWDDSQWQWGYGEDWSEQVPESTPAKPTYPPGPWSCASCGFSNKSSNFQCGGTGPLGCKTARPPPVAPVQELAKPLQRGPKFAGGATAVVDDEDKRYTGRIKRFYELSGGGGYGFVECNEAKMKWGRDVYIHVNQMKGFQIGDSVSFLIIRNAKGEPQARNVMRTEDAVIMRAQQQQNQMQELQSKWKPTEDSDVPPVGGLMDEEQAKKFQASLKRKRM